MKQVLSGVQDTLYIPLVARIYASEHFPQFFYDEKALSLAPLIPSEGIRRGSCQYFFMASTCRAQTVDEKIKTFLAEHDECNVVFLGVGLETAYYRLNNGRARFYSVDLPDVISLRERLLSRGENEYLVAGDMFDLQWVNGMDPTLPTMIAVVGVFEYFEEGRIIDLIRKMKEIFPRGELVFDATNAKGLAVANKYVRKTGNAHAQMYFSVDNPADFAGRTGTRLVRAGGLFENALKNCPGLNLKTRLYMYFADRWGRTMVVHLAFF